MKHLLKFILLFTFISSYSQEFVLRGSLKDYQFQKIYLAAISGDRYKLIDSSKTNFLGGFSFKFNKKANIGQYRLLVEDHRPKSDAGKKGLIDFIFNKEDIDFYTLASAPLDSMHVINSVENRLYYDYILYIKANMKKLDQMNYQLYKNPDADELAKKEAEKKIKELNEERNSYITDFCNKNPLTFVSHIVRSDKSIIVDPAFTEDQKKEFLRNHFFDETDFNDSLLINTNVLGSKILGYLSLYREKQYDKEKQEISFIHAVDFIMKVANKNKKVYEFVLDYMITGFESFEFEKVINYIADNNKLDDFCQNSDDKTTLETKIESYKKFAVGKSVPEITIPDVNGKQVRLSDIKTDYVLILFWASWCPHCESLLPEIVTVYKSQKQKKFEVLAISIDHERKEWTAAIDRLNTSWINCSELKGWDGLSVKDLDIYATPTLYLVNKNKTIIAKPLSIGDLKQALEL